MHNNNSLIAGSVKSCKIESLTSLWDNKAEFNTEAKEHELIGTYKFISKFMQRHRHTFNKVFRYCKKYEWYNHQLNIFLNQKKNN